MATASTTATFETDLHSDHSPTAYGANVVQYVNAMKAKDATIKVGAVLTAPGPVSRRPVA